MRRSSFGKPSTARDLSGAQAQVASRGPGTMASPEGSEPGPGDGRGGKVVKSLHLRRGKRRTKEDARAPECSYGRTRNPRLLGSGGRAERIRGAFDSET